MIFSVALSVLIILQASASPLLAPPLERPHARIRTTLISNGILLDAPASISKSQADSIPLICPNGIQKGQTSRNILFVHGTGASGDSSFRYGLASAFAAKGYSSCWMNMPNKSLDDAQLTSEHVYHLIHRLYRLAGINPIYLVGHSQGNLNIQWALNFFPSTRKMVYSFAALSADFHGTTRGPLFASAQKVLMDGTVPSVLQQSVLDGKPSRFLQALNKHGNVALVPTTSIYGLQDRVIHPIKKTTVLRSGGAPFTHVATQELCPHIRVGHVGVLTNRAAFYLILDAFEHKSNANVNRVKRDHPDICEKVEAPGIVHLSKMIIYRQSMDLSMAIGLAGYGTPSGAFSFQTKVEPDLVPHAAHQP